MNTNRYHKAYIETNRLIARIPSLDELDNYVDMLSNREFIACYGVSYDHEKAAIRLQNDIDHWNKNGFAPWMWYDKNNHTYVGRAGLKSFMLDQKNEIELTYQIRQEYWGQGIAVEMGLASIVGPQCQAHLACLF